MKNTKLKSRLPLMIQVICHFKLSLYHVLIWFGNVLAAMSLQGFVILHGPLSPCVYSPSIHKATFRGVRLESGDNEPEVFSVAL